MVLSHSLGAFVVFRKDLANPVMVAGLAIDLRDRHWGRHGIGPYFNIPQLFNPTILDQQHNSRSRV